MSRIKKIWIAAGVLPGPPSPRGRNLRRAAVLRGEIRPPLCVLRPAHARAGRALPVPAVSGQSPAPAAPTPIPSPTQDPEEALAETADFSFLKDTVNILVLGWDHSPERDDEDNVLYRDEDNNFRSDVLILLAVDFEQKSVDMISIPGTPTTGFTTPPASGKSTPPSPKGAARRGRGLPMP